VLGSGEAEAGRAAGDQNGFHGSPWSGLQYPDFRPPVLD